MIKISPGRTKFSLLRSFDESKKSEKSIASMIVKNKGEGDKEGQGGSKKEQKKKSVKIAERAEEPQVTLLLVTFFASFNVFYPFFNGKIWRESLKTSGPVYKTKFRKCNV